MESHITAVFAVILLVVLSAYFSATETAFTSFNRIRMKNMAAGGSKKAKAVMDVAEGYDKLLSTTLIGSNIVNIIIASLATVIFVDLYGERIGATVSVLVVTLVILIFAEVSPKSVAKEMPEKFCIFTTPAIRVFLFVFAPLNYLFSKWKQFLTKVFSIDSASAITEGELLTIVEEAETEGSIEKEQSELIQNAIGFNELESWDVLTPRADVKAVDVNTPKEGIAKLFIETGFSRLPVYDETIDKIIGVLNQKDFSNYIANTGKGISEFIKPVVFVAGSVKIAALLKKMQKVKTHIAVIIDEYGGTEGIVTMEDIIEELVGEIYDEHEEITTQEFLQMQDGSFRILCSANAIKMFNYFDIKQEEIDATTVNGWVVLELGKIPEVGDAFSYKSLSVTVTRADEKKALEIKVVRDEACAEGERE